MKKVDLAYMAGIFDGEGCITFHRRYKQKDRKNLDIPTNYWLRCSINNTNRWLIEWFKFSFGGRIYLQYKGSPNQQDCWMWVVISNQAISFLEIISPYLKIKKPQAELALKLKTQRKASRWHPITEEEKIVREAEYILMKNLKRGQ